MDTDTIGIPLDDDILWTEKYRPQTLNDYYISDTQYTIINEWILSLINNVPNAKPILILHGTAGIGKTTIAHLILQKYNYEIIECNASDTRSKAQIHDTLGGISKVSVCIDDNNNFKKTALILDEIDGVSDIMGIQEIINIVIYKKHKKTIILKNPKAPKDPKAPKTTNTTNVPKTTRANNANTFNNNTRAWVCPVICTSNNIKTKPIQLLSKYSIILNLDIPTYNNCLKLINKITINENLTITQDIKDNIINNANGDYRQIIMLLYQSHIPSQTHTETHTETHIETHIETHTNKQINNICYTPLEKINYFITHKLPLELLTHISSGDTTLFFLNFYTNIISIIYEIQHKQPYKNKSLYTKKHTDYLLNYYNILYKIYNYISLADIINNKIYINKQWELLQYVDMFSIAIPTTLLYNINIKQNNTKHQSNTNTNTNNNKQIINTIRHPQLIINNFDLCHHSQYNSMTCEHAIIKKKLNIDYMKTFEKNITNIYYNIKRFQYTHIIQNIQNINTDNKNCNIHHPIHMQLNTISPYSIIDKTYIKILSKIDELLN